MNTKKVLIIVIAFVIVILFVGLYFLFSSSKTPVPATQTRQAGNLPSAGTQSDASGTGGAGALATENSSLLGTSFGLISNQPTLAYFVDPENNVISIQPDGEIDETTNGQTSMLSSLTIQNIISASFSYDGTKALVNFGNPADPQTSIFNVAAKTWAPMNAGWQSPAWSPSDYRIAYATASSNGTESFWTLDASKAKATPVALLTLHAENLSLAWLNKSELALETKPSALVAGSVWLFNIQNRTLAAIAAEVPGLETTWDETTSTGLQFSAGASEIGGSLQLINVSGDTVQRIKFLTLPSKCAFASSTSASSTSSTLYLYCGVPRDQSDLAYDRLPDDYNQMALFTSDDIYRINLSSGAVDTVFDNQNQNVDVSDLELFNGTLFFINRYDQKLYAIQLASEM